MVQMRLEKIKERNEVRIARCNADRAMEAEVGGDDALASAVRIRKLFDSKQLVPGVKALLSRIRNAPALAEVLPPFVPLTDVEAASLFQAYEKALQNP